MSNESKTPRTVLATCYWKYVAGGEIHTLEYVEPYKMAELELELATLQSRIEQSMSERAKGLLHEKELLDRIERLTKAGDGLHEASFSCGCNSCLIARAVWQEAKK